ncbi:hypothetical protein WIS52_21895 [Pseudonocardia nematodicida]|uniref:Uncharacterized protein n=1 Tax=Pseudonocardia nematodicida TaxID=1206997 RepID=A0ABV1KF80_9PSEU
MRKSVRGVIVGAALMPLAFAGPGMAFAGDTGYDDDSYDSSKDHSSYEKDDDHGYDKHDHGKKKHDKHDKKKTYDHEYEKWDMDEGDPAPEPVSEGPLQVESLVSMIVGGGEPTAIG